MLFPFQIKIERFFQNKMKWREKGAENGWKFHMPGICSCKNCTLPILGNTPKTNTHRHDLTDAHTDKKLDQIITVSHMNIAMYDQLTV